MRRFGIGVRWWLGAAFALVAAVTAAAVIAVFSNRAEHAFRNRAEELVVGSAFVATQEIGQAVRESPHTLDTDIVRIARDHRLSIFLYAADGRLRAASGGGAPSRSDPAVASVLKGARYVASSDNGRHVVVGMPLHVEGIAGIVARSSRIELPAELGIVQDQTVRAGLIAVLAGAVLGLVLAQLISLRLRRMAAAAESIRGGDFETPLESRFPDEFGSVAAALERMRIELRRSFGDLEFERDRLRLLLERLQEGVVMVDRRLTVQFANGEARRILGSRLREGEPLPEAWTPLPLRGLAARLFESDAPLAQTRADLEDGRTISIVGIPAGAGADAALLVLGDLTEQERRDLSEREFVANAAHELRTPLTTIIGAVEVLQAGAKELPEERDRFLGHIEREAARLGRLARALLVLARAQTRTELPQAEPVALGPLLDEIARGLAPRDGVAVEVDCASGLEVPANRDLLEQAVRNLAENAVKHTLAGRVVLRAGHARGGLVRVEVEDTGRGIDPETQRHIFDRFYRGQGRDPDGFGLGLAIVRQAVRALDASVELDSAPDAGTRIAILLPASARGVEAA